MKNILLNRWLSKTDGYTELKTNNKTKQKITSLAFPAHIQYRGIAKSYSFMVKLLQK